MNAKEGSRKKMTKANQRKIRAMKNWGKKTPTSPQTAFRENSRPLKYISGEEQKVQLGTIRQIDIGALRLPKPGRNGT